MNSDTVQELTIERLVFGGEGLARRLSGDSDPGQARGKAIFVPGTLPGEVVLAGIEEEHRSYARAHLLRVLQPAAGRQIPPCPYFGDCGGCQWQHASADDQLKFKQAILEETLRRLAGLSDLPPVEMHASPPWQYRNRARWRVLEGGARLGYRRMHSRQPLGVEQCGLLHPALEKLIRLPWPPPPPELEELEAAVNDRDEIQLLWLARELNPRVMDWCRSAVELAAARAAAIGVAGRLEALAGGGCFQYRVGDFDYRLGPGAFFQVNRFLLPALVAAMTAGTAGARALDLYSGVGLFALPLAGNFLRVSAVEAESVAAGDLVWNARHALPAATAGRLQVSAMTVEEYLQRAGGEFDLALVDPPRAGLSREVTSGLLRLQPARLHYLSCDPATLARDLKSFIAAGYAIEQLHLFDLFPQTYHLETLARLRRD